MTTIPDAQGLTEELEKRVSDLIVGTPAKRMAPSGIHQVTTYELFSGDERLGIVDVNSYDWHGVRRVAHAEYTGRVPGYVNSITGKDEILMIAHEDRTLDPGEIIFERKRYTQPNNTAFNPLYRHDGHPLRLADHEVDGKKRVVVR